MSLTETQFDLLSLLRNRNLSYNDICNELDVSYSTARDHISALKREGIALGEDREDGSKVFYLKEEAGEHPTNHTEQNYKSASSKREKTKKANSKMRKLEKRLNRLLENSEPAIADGGLEVEQSNEDVVIHATDDHIGDEETDEYGNTTFSTDIAVQRRRSTFDTCMNLVDRQRSAGYSFDNAHLLIGGDIITGETVYDHQPHEIDRTVDEQIDIATKLYMEQIRRLAQEFDAVQVVCQSGNHGDIGASSSSKDLNGDKLVYMMLDKMVRESELENVTFIRNDSTRFTNFDIRGHRGHLRHGDDSLEHIGTSSGKRRWFNWRDKHQFDIAYRGHYHQFQYDTLTRTKATFPEDEDSDPHYETENVPVIMTGSLKPPSDFEESIAQWSQPSGTIHGVSDSRPLTWFFPVTFDD